MRPKFLLSSVSILLVIGSCTCISPGLLKFGIDLFLKTIPGLNISVPLTTLTVPKDFQDIIIGKLNLTTLSVYGLNTFTYSDSVLALTSDKKGFTRNNITILGSFNNIGIKSDYYLDMGLLDLAPLYGKGTFSLGLTKIDFLLNVILSDRVALYNMSIANLDMRLSFRHSSKSYVTGFWHSDAGSNLITDVINVLEPVFCMWYNYEKECLDCVLSKVLQFVINLAFGAKSLEPSIECNCFEELEFITRLNLNNIVEAWTTDDYIYIKDQLINNKDFQTLFSNIYNNIQFALQEQKING